MALPLLRLVGAEPASARPLGISNGGPIVRMAMAGLGSPNFLLRHELQALGLGPKSVDIYSRRIRSADAWCVAQGSTLAKASGPLIARYADTLPRGWSTRKELRSAARWYWVIVKRKNPPVSFLRVPPKPAMVCKALEEDDARILAKVARQAPFPGGLALALGVYQAMRREEIATLPWAALGGPKLTIIGKGEKQRTIPVHPEILDKLVGIERVGTYVFPGRFGSHVAPATIWAWIRKLGADAGLPNLTPHQLRHTCLAAQNDNGKNLRAVQQFAGHSRPETTSGYTRTTEAALYESMMSVDYLGERQPARRRRPAKRWPWEQPSLFGGPDEDEEDDEW